MITEKEKQEFFSGFEVAYQILDYKDLVKFIDVFIDEKLSKLSQGVVSDSVCDCNKLPDGEIAISSKALTDPNWTDGQTDC